MAVSINTRIINVVAAPVSGWGTRTRTSEANSLSPYLHACSKPAEKQKTGAHEQIDATEGT